MPKNAIKSNASLLENKPLRLTAPRVRVDYPRDGETVTHPSYALRIAVTAPAAGVDVCVDQGDWRPCRESLGFWWYDWSGYESGEHEAVARLRKPNGGTESSDTKVFFVALPR